MSSVVTVENRGLMERVRVNYQILENPYWSWPVDEKGHMNFSPVGRGQRTSLLCGQWQHFWVCDNVEGHKGVVLKGVDYTGKLVVTHQHFWCHKPSCPVCFIRGWAVRLARSMANRLAVASEERGFGKVEHVIVSPALVDHWLDESVLREKCRGALFDRGVVGGAMIFHGYRMDRKRRVLAWSPHYHTLGFVDGGFDRCRDCVHGYGDCDACSGFKGREVRGYAKDGYLVSVKGERLTVVGTGFYQLHHATIRVGLKRFMVVTWFGNCGNRKFKGRKAKAVAVCPVCQDEMKKKVYVGSVFIVRDIGNPWYMKVFAMSPLDSSGLPNFVDAGGG